MSISKKINYFYIISTILVVLLLFFMKGPFVDHLKFSDQDHVHFLVQSVPKYSPTEVISIIKSITAKEIFKQHPEVKKILWGSEFWSDGYFVGSMGEYGNEQMLRKYVQQQGDPNHYKALVKQQLTLFE